MKRILSIIMCLLLAFSIAMADTADTLPKKFNRQLIGGNGVRGYIRITASGVAEWLNMLLPFTATDIQIRAIGEKQGDVSQNITDDDDWQVRFYAKNIEDEEVGTTWLYGDPAGVYFQSELLPGTLLTIPVENVNLLYQLLRGDYEELFFAFDPMQLMKAGTQGTVPAYDAVSKMLGIPQEEWEAEWLPVLEKYFLHLDLWLAGFGDPSFVTNETGSLTMSATYQIPAEELKAEAKYLIGQMLYDTELQNLLLPYVTMEQRVTYLNPGMVYFYEACIDALPLNGDIVLSREMSAQGEIVGARVSLPIPALPQKITAPVDDCVELMFGLTDFYLMDGMDRIEFSQNGGNRTLTISGSKRSVILSADEIKKDDHTITYSGSLLILPVNAQEQCVAAVFECTVGHRLWQDEKYIDHDTSNIAFSIEPYYDYMTENSDRIFAEFSPVAFDWSVDYRNNPYQDNSPVQINYVLNAQLPDASVQAEAVLRISTQMKLEALPTAGAVDIGTLDESQKTEMVEAFISNAVLLMASLNGEPVEAEGLAEQEAAAAEPTAVPPVIE